MKKKTALKKLLTIVMTILTITIALFGVRVKVNVIGTSNYWESDEKLNIEYALDEHQDTIDCLDYEYKDLERLVVEDTKSSEELPANYQKLVNKLNQVIINYFARLNVDVTERLSKLNVRLVDFQEAQINGFYNNGLFDNNVYIYKEIIQDGMFYQEGLFEMVYIHETMHYLGVCSKNSVEFTYIYEGLTEAIVEKICENSQEVYYFETSSYVASKEVADEIIKIYPEIIAEIVSAEGEYNLEKKINSICDAEQLDQLIKLRDNGHGDDDVNFILQYIVYELSKEAGELLEENVICDNFGIKWLMAN